MGICMCMKSLTELLKGVGNEHRPNAYLGGIDRLLVFGGVNSEVAVVSYMDIIHVFIGISIGLVAGIAAGVFIAEWGGIWKL